MNEENPTYEIGKRLRGYAKKEIINLNEFLSKELDINPSKRIVPHITFLRPFKTNDENKLISKFNETLKEYSKPIYFCIEHFGIFKNKEKIFYANIKQNSEIEKIIGGLEKSLEDIIKYKHKKISLPEEENSINLHSTILKIPNYLMPEITRYMNNNPLKKIDQALLRVYLLKNKRILREYDFFLEKSLTREEAKDKQIFQETIKTFNKKTSLKASKKGFTKIKN